MQTTDFALCVYFTLQGTVDLGRPPSHLLYIEPVLCIVLEFYFTLQCGPPALSQHFTELPFCAALHWICPLLCRFMQMQICACSLLLCMLHSFYTFLYFTQHWFEVMGEFTGGELKDRWWWIYNWHWRCLTCLTWSTSFCQDFYLWLAIFKGSAFVYVLIELIRIL